MLSRKTLVGLIILCCGVTSAYTFQPVVLQTWAYGKTGSYFGYVVQLNGEKVYVGAPKEDDSGAVYECDFYGCTKIILNIKESSDYVSLSTGQQLGSSLDTFEDKLVACAPRWINQKYIGHHFLNGLCFIRNLSSKADEIYIPLMSTKLQGIKDEKNKSYYNYVYGQAGFSIDISKDGYFTMGAPGVLQWLGTVVQYNQKSGNMNPFVPEPKVFFKTIYPEMNEINQVESEFFGYAVASGKFRNIGLMSVAGAPRANSLTGQVFVYKNNVGPFNISIQHKFSGREIGEYFGSVLAVGDITGDGYDDILVGAPLYSGRDTESGCIYVFVNEERGFSQQIIESYQRKARFGTAISIIGDIDQDGYNDVAIGAPFESQNGIVYIYLSSKKGLIEQPYHRIKGTAINIGFGFSISRGVHNAETGVAHVAVGAHKSAHVLMLNFRPVIRVYSTLKANEEKLNFEKITLEKNFTFSLTACLKFTAKYITNRKYSFNTSIIADPFYSRVILLNSTKIIACKNNESCCTFYPMQLKENNYKHFSLKPLEFRFEYNVWGIQKEKIDPAFPEFNLNNPTSELLSVPFEIDCGGKDACEPELTVDASWLLDSDTYIIGSTTHIDIQIIIHNSGDNAYSCMLQVNHNIPLRRLPETCVQIEQDILECNMGNPLKAKSQKMFSLQFDPLFLEETQSGISVSLNLTSIGNESRFDDNVKSLNLKIGREINIMMNSVSKPDQFRFNYTDENTTEIVQLYELHNLGPSPINLFIFILSIPNTIHNQSSSIVEISGTEIMNNEVLNTYCDYQLITWQNKYFTMLDSFCKLNTSYLSDWEKYKSTFYKCQSNAFGCTQYFCACNGKNVKDISVKITMEVNLNSLKEKLDDEEIIVFTTNVMPLVSNKTYENCHEAGTIFIAESKPTDVFPWIIVGIAIGSLILLILVIALWKVGFFKRMVLPTADDVAGIMEDDDNILEKYTFEEKES